MEDVDRHRPPPAGPPVAQGWPATRRPERAGAPVTFRPILDVARAAAAGYQAVGPLDGVRLGPGPVEPSVRAAAAFTLEAALAATSTLPTNTFVSVPLPLGLADDDRMRGMLRDHGDLGGIVLDVTNFSTAVLPAAEAALAGFREAGALLAVGGHDAPQPELGSVVRLRPSIIRLGGAWVRGVDSSSTTRSAIELTGRLAGQLDAWILAESVSTPAELRALAELGVPLVQGPLVGGARQVWPGIDPAAAAMTPTPPPPGDGPLRRLVRAAYTTSDVDATTAAIPGSSGADLVVVVDDRSRPVALLEQDPAGRWESSAVLTVNVDTPVPEAASRAMARPRRERFSPVACTDSAGRFLGILRIDQLVEHLADGAAPHA